MNTEFVTQFEEENATSLLVEETENQVVECAASVPLDTALLSEEVLPEDIYLEDIDYAPHLIRKSTGERADIFQNLFKIGKKVGYSDYIIQGNSAVSRIHADILREDETFYIRDNGSTNGTYINGVRIPPQELIEIFDGDEIRLANERFEFHLI